jgi:xylan 1,4-beta-xylosidase
MPSIRSASTTRISLRLLFALALVVIPPAKSFAQAAPQALAEAVEIDANAASHPLPHFWEKMFGSGRAILSLRDDYRHDLRETKRITDFEYIRFHAIFHDEVGLYDEDANGKPVYNFSYVDEIYDGLLANKVRPFVELSFMPKKLTSDPRALHAFWYKQNVAPPKDWDKWGQLIETFTRHLVERYGIEEVSQWYFEVWNEPNIDFWVGNPKEETYYQLYDQAALAVKRVSPRLRVGGPSTAQPRGLITSSLIAKRKTFPSISFPLTSTATTKPKTSSGRMKKFRATKWCAGR